MGEGWPRDRQITRERETCWENVQSVAGDRTQRLTWLEHNEPLKMMQVREAKWIMRTVSVVCSKSKET